MRRHLYPRMRSLQVLVLLCLSACNTPHPLSDFAGVPPTRVEVDGALFDVRIAGRKVQAIRTNPDWRAALAQSDAVARAGLAMEVVSGCALVSGSLQGDPALAEARLTC